MDITESDQRLNEMVEAGQALDAFEEFYAEDLVMQENSEPPRVGKDANRLAEQEFFSSIAAWHDGRCLGSAVNGNTSYSEWIMEVTFKNGYRYKLEQVAVRQWNDDGQIVFERFFYNKG